MMHISKIKEKYARHINATQDLLKILEKENSPIKYKIANEVLKDLSDRIDKTFNAIILLASEKQLYPSFILYRSLLEHFIKSFYIFSKTMKEKNDTAAEAYQKHYFISEFLAEKAGVLEMENLTNHHEPKINYLDFLTKEIPELKEFSLNDQREISKAIKQFNLQEIVKYFHNDLSRKDGNPKMDSAIAKIIPEYSFVSTFTHGGAYAGVLMTKFSKNKTYQEQLNRIVQISFTSCLVSKENYLTTYQLNIKQLSILNSIIELRNSE